MKKILYILLILILGISFNFETYSQQFKTSGKVINTGLIKIKNRQLKQTGGRIENDSGKIVIDAPTAVFSQDTLMGRIDYVLNGGISNNQYVPQIVYYDIRMAGNSKKLLTDTTKNLTSLARFVSHPEVYIDLNNQSEIDVLGYITHDGYVNLGKSTGLVSMIGGNPQDIDGKGLFKELELDNSTGADVINTGGFKVNTTLELNKGEFRNSDTNNFVMMDDSKIIRHVGASISYTPQLEGIVSVKYVGTGHMFTGEEIPDDTNALADLEVQNTEGITLSKNATANRKVIVGTKINTEIDDNNQFVLTSTSGQDPVFASNNSEIIGSFQRTNLDLNNKKLLFNNNFTYALFVKPEDANDIKKLTFRVRPKVFPPNSETNTKVIRDIYISAVDGADNPVMNGLNMEVGYAWRNSTDTAKNETNGLKISDVIFQHWSNSKWNDIKSSQVPQLNNPDEWAYSYATQINQLGQFAIGISSIGNLVFYSRALLEGPYRFGTMANDLAAKNLIPTKPPKIYPYNMDPYLDSTVADSIMPDVVDWVLLEFRKDSMNSQDKYYRSCFILQNGQIVDIDGKSAVNASSIGAGKYFVILRHRNHLAVASNDLIDIEPTSSPTTFNFTNPANIQGGASALKPVGFDQNNSYIYALIGGDVDGDGIITDYDSQYISGGEVNKIWEKRDSEAYLNRDALLLGIINTRDINLTWNNRGRVSFIIPYK